VLPQTQCRRCGFDGCLPYAMAMAQGQAKPNRCPPGGPPGHEQLAMLLNQTFDPALDKIDPIYGELMPLRIAYILTNQCIGCTKCIDVCPTDAIVGASKQLHVVISSACTGCDLCLPPCPVDCIEMRTVDNRVDAQGTLQMSWQQWQPEQVSRAKTRYEKKQHRIQRSTAQAEFKAQATSAAESKDTVEQTPEKALEQRLARARNMAQARLEAIAKQKQGAN
jgi:Na+-translocating ferredoxin:NAD+ oxidoreductase subunit B